MTSNLQSRLICRLFIIGLLFRGTICNNTDNDTVLGAALEAYSGIKNKGQQALESISQKRVDAREKILRALQSAVNFGQDEAQHVFDRYDSLISETIPKHVAILKESASETLGVLGDHLSNVRQRTLSNWNELNKAASDVSQTALEEGNKVKESKKELLRSVSNLASAVGSKIYEGSQFSNGNPLNWAYGVGDSVMSAAGSAISKPREYAGSMLTRVNPFSWGYGY